MAAMTALTLNTKVYNPRGTVNAVSTWALVGDATFGGGTSYATESVRGPSKDGITRSTFKLDIPKLATADSACSCVGGVLGTGIFRAEVAVPSNFTAAERADFAARAQAMIAHAIFTSAVVDSEGSW